MKAEIVTTPAVTEERIVMVPKTETVVVTPAVQEVTLTLNTKEAQHIFEILGGRIGIDSELGATGQGNFEYRVWGALNGFLKAALPGHVSEPQSTASGRREVERNAAFRRLGGYTFT